MSMCVYDDLYVRTASTGLPCGFYRIVWMTDRAPDLVLVQVPTYADAEHQTKLKLNMKRPLVVEKRTVESALSSGHALKSDASEDFDKLRKKEPVLSAVLSPKEQKRAAILNDFDSEATVILIFGSGWEREMLRLSKKYGDSTSTIKRLILKYFYTGRNLEETVKNKRRPKGLSRLVTKKLGRKKDIVKTGRTSDEGINREQHQELIITYLVTKGKDVSKKSIRYLHDEFYGYFAVEIVKLPDGEVDRKRIPENQRISLAQFRTIVKDFDKTAYLLRSFSSRKGRIKTDVHIGEARDMTSFAGHTYIIDSTVADIYLVSSYDRNKILGRPVIYLVIDARTSLLLSVYVTLWGPSYAEARNALFLAYSDKKAYLKYLQLEEFEECFRAGPRPLDVLADRAELLSENGKELARRHESGLSITAAYQPVWKSLVERSFKRLNELIIHYLPGMVPREQNRGDEDCRYQAAFTLWEFRRLMTLEQIEWNASKAMGKWLSPQMLKAGVKASPLAMWDWSLKNEHGSASLYDIDHLITTSLEPELVSVTTQGILSTNKLKWTAEWMKDHHDVKLSKVQRCTATLIQSPEDPTLAFCRMPSEDNYREVYLRNAPKSAYPITKEDVEDHIAEKRFADEMSAAENTHLKDELTTRQVQLTEAAKASTAASVRASATTKAARKKDMYETRAAETEYEKTGQPHSFEGNADADADVEKAVVDGGSGDTTKAKPSVASDIDHDVADFVEEW